MSRSWRSASRRIGLHRPNKMGTTESLSCVQGTTNLNPITYRAIQRSGMPIHRHSMHHTNQTNLTNSLLQDISTFNEHYSTKLEEELMDIETAADIINKSQAKLAKAKSRGLTCTLVMEPINSEKTWDEIKDLLRLNLCNANIHTYSSHSMNMQ